MNREQILAFRRGAEQARVSGDLEKASARGPLQLRGETRMLELAIEGHQPVPGPVGPASGSPSRGECTDGEGPYYVASPASEVLSGNLEAFCEYGS